MSSRVNSAPPRHFPLRVVPVRERDCLQLTFYRSEPGAA